MAKTAQIITWMASMVATGTIARDIARNRAAPSLRAVSRRKGCRSDTIVMPGLTKLLGGTSQILLGSDYPFGNVGNTVDGLRTLGFSEQDLRGIDRENALKILPKYGGG